PFKNRKKCGYNFFLQQKMGKDHIPVQICSEEWRKLSKDDKKYWNDLAIDYNKALVSYSKDDHSINEPMNIQTKETLMCPSDDNHGNNESEDSCSDNDYYEITNDDDDV